MGSISYSLFHFVEIDEYGDHAFFPLFVGFFDKRNAKGYFLEKAVYEDDTILNYGDIIYNNLKFQCQFYDEVELIHCNVDEGKRLWKYFINKGFQLTDKVSGSNHYLQTIAGNGKLNNVPL